MRRTLLTIALMVSIASGAFALTLREAYDQIEKMPDLTGVEKGKFSDILHGWLGAIPFDDASVTYKIHEVGDGQTVFYGSKVEEIAGNLPKSELILFGADYSNIIYFYAKPLSDKSSELLILIDQAYQGKTTAIIGKVSNQIVDVIKAGEIKFSPDHKIIVNVPIMVCD